MAAKNWNPGLPQDVSYHPKDLLRGVTSRRRASLGSDAALDADADRDPEMPVDDYEELYRCVLDLDEQFLGGLLTTAVHC